MKSIFSIVTIADFSISPLAVVVVAILLALLVLIVSISLFRKSEVRRCPYCNAVVTPGAQFCPNCGREQPVAVVTTPEGY